DNNDSRRNGDHPGVDGASHYGSPKPTKEAIHHHDTDSDDRRHLPVNRKHSGHDNGGTFEINQYFEQDSEDHGYRHNTSCGLGATEPVERKLANGVPLWHLLAENASQGNHGHQGKAIRNN